MKTPEAIEKNKVKAFLNEIGAFHRWPVPRGYGKPDIDCHAGINGTMWIIEVKAPGEEPTPQQYRTLKEAAVADCQVVWGTGESIIGAIETWMRSRVGVQIVGAVISNVWSPLS